MVFGFVGSTAATFVVFVIHSAFDHRRESLREARVLEDAKRVRPAVAALAARSP
jgi:DNA helicase HerA-like ATPase